MLNEDKRLAARAAAEEVADGMLVGLGTGSTAAHLIEALGERVAAGLSIRAVATSEASAALARERRIPVLDMARVAHVDLTIDGADEIDARFLVIKGAGGAMLREKVVAAASTRMVVIADGSKRVQRIGAARLPVEVLPFAQRAVLAQLERMGGEPVVRQADGADYLTDNGNLVADCLFGTEQDWMALAARLDAVAGVVGHGLFLTEVDAAYLADGGVVSRLERAGALG